ncbi:COG4705 family protein [Mycobacterium sp. Marseille-P9652]|uniref:COG4705 family protein n=1 Tax=Mycobacterium sp. Marseille-P9652 TaxID=2654950 RepID=UPI0012E7D34C
MAESREFDTAGTEGARLSKVPEVTVWFWIIKILCTTVGVSFADWLDTTLGMTKTALIFPVVIAAVLALQLRLNRYVPFVYWLVVVVFRLAGTLYADLLVIQFGVPLSATTGIFTAALALIFGVWYARERTLDLHSIVTLPRESFYWLAVFVTFALGTAAGDWTVQLTGWGSGTSALLWAGLLVAIVIGWRLGANAVLSFWLAYVLTGPLGANVGDWLATPPSGHGLGLGISTTSTIGFAAILAMVAYLTWTRRDVIEERKASGTPTVRTDAARERIMLGYYAVVAVATAALLVWSAASR